MKHKINRILNTLRHTHGISRLNEQDDICHVVVTARATRPVDFSSLRLYLRTLAKAAGLECDLEHGGGYLYLTFYVAETAVTRKSP